MARRSSSSRAQKVWPIQLDISLEPVTFHNFVDAGFTRNFASSPLQPTLV